MSRKISIALVVILGIITTGYVACAEMFPSGAWQYKITVNIETPEGLKTAHAVRKVVARRQPQFPNPDMSPIVYQVYGEAVVIDLGERGLLFSLIDWDSYQEVYNAFPFRSFDPNKILEYYEGLKVGERANLSRGPLKIVTYSDLNDPKTVRLVYQKTPDSPQDKIKDQFQSIFGDGVHLRDVTIEITDDPVTTNEIISQLASSSGPFRNSSFQTWFNALPFDDERQVHIYHFSKKENSHE